MTVCVSKLSALQRSCVGTNHGQAARLTALEYNVQPERFAYLRQRMSSLISGESSTDFTKLMSPQENHCGEGAHNDRRPKRRAGDERHKAVGRHFNRRRVPNHCRDCQLFRPVSQCELGLSRSNQ